MRRSFSLPRTYVVSSEEAALRREVADHTGSEDETESILRSLERLGSDATIRCYDVTPVAARRAYRGASPVTWTVRAVRG